MIKFPDSTRVNKNVPKNVFYKHLEVSTKMKRIFVNDVERIVWGYKFAPSTLNVADGKQVHEITVFEVDMKVMECPGEMFVFIDKNIPRHTIFILHCEGKSCTVINYKESVQGNASQPYKVTKTYQSEWRTIGELALQLDGNTMDAIYEKLVRQVAGEQILEASGTLKEDIAISQEQEDLKKEIAALKKRITLERQPQKKFMLHKQLRELENKLK
jgi:hypothetical protein